MLENKIAFISNYFWKRSIDNINAILSVDQAGFNMNDYYYLTVIHQLGNPNLGDVAKELKLTKPAISAMVQRLIKNDLIQKTQSAEDKRVFFLNLTEKSLKIIQGDNQLYRDLAVDLESFLSAQQRLDLECLLTMLVDKMTESEKE